MKRRILILDAFTNGHEATLAFIKRRGWLEDECEIVFCGTHINVLERLTGGPAYAVVAIRNSIAGEVTDVTTNLARLREVGYDLQERDHLELQINHCLLAPRNVVRAEDLQSIMSHEKAIQQCGKFLTLIGITPDRRSARDSTGNAAKVVARLGPDAKVGAIAPKAAAQEYGLKVLAERIQDVPDNKTTFLLLENQAKVEPKVVGIIGINGRFGQLLKNFFEKIGCSIIGSGDKNPTDLSNVQVVERSQVVIFSVPIKKTPSVIRSVTPYIRRDQLLMDVTSVKQPAVTSMLESEAQVVVGLHPMFRPEVTFKGQTVVVCPARLTSPEWKLWVVNMLAATGSKIKWSTPEKHDSHMSVVQVTPHLSNLTSALLIADMGISASESLTYTSPFYRVMFSLMGRLLSQSPDLYTSIIMENPETVPMLLRRIAIEQDMVDMIRNKDQSALEGLFAKASEHFGPEVIGDANELFVRILGVLSTLHGENSVTLEFDKEQNRPGLLEHISGVFSRRQINLAGINSVKLGEQRLQFTIGFEQSSSSDEVRRALEEIEQWSSYKVKIIR